MLPTEIIKLQDRLRDFDLTLTAYNLSTPLNHTPDAFHRHHKNLFGLRKSICIPFNKFCWQYFILIRCQRSENGILNGPKFEPSELDVDSEYWTLVLNWKATKILQLGSDRRTRTWWIYLYYSDGKLWFMIFELRNWFYGPVQLLEDTRLPFRQFTVTYNKNFCLTLPELTQLSIFIWTYH